jgi:hypothetical protein
VLGLLLSMLLGLSSCLHGAACYLAIETHHVAGAHSVSASCSLAVLQTIRAGLKALQGLGVWGVAVNVWWSQVEAQPKQYDWAQYQAVFDAAREIGLRVKVRSLCMCECSGMQATAVSRAQGAGCILQLPQYPNSAEHHAAARCPAGRAVCGVRLF